MGVAGIQTLQLPQADSSIACVALQGLRHGQSVEIVEVGGIALQPCPQHRFAIRQVHLIRVALVEQADLVKQRIELPAPQQLPQGLQRQHSVFGQGIGLGGGVSAILPAMLPTAPMPWKKASRAKS